MPDLYDSIRITSTAATVCDIMGVEKDAKFESVNPIVTALADKKLNGRKADRAVLYNPDAVALWLYQRYTENSPPPCLSQTSRFQCFRSCRA